MRAPRNYRKKAKTAPGPPTIDSGTFRKLSGLTETKHELAIAISLYAAGLLPDPEGQIQFRFHPDRKFRLDFAWPDSRVALESEGGVHRAFERQYRSDLDKFNEAQLMGWIVLRVSTKEDPNSVPLLIERALSRSF
jgi:hypothetical protein